MRRLLVLFCAGLVAAAVFSAAAVAGGNPHFIKSATSASLNGSSLVCNFKETGLSSGSTENVACNATETVAYECVNNGGKNPQASNKSFFTSDVSKSGSFTADQSGNITGSLTLTPLSAQDVNFTCPGGQTVTFAGVSYSDVSITDATSGATISLPGPFSYTNPAAP